MKISITFFLVFLVTILYVTCGKQTGAGDREEPETEIAQSENSMHENNDITKRSVGKMNIETEKAKKRRKKREAALCKRVIERRRKAKEQRKRNSTVCRNLPKDLHGLFQLDDLSGITLFGAIASLRCAEGYTTASSVVIKCGKNGKWSLPDNLCRPRDCLSLPRESHGCFELDNLSKSTFGATATLRCSQGYATNTKVVVTCVSNGSWSTPTEECSAVECGVGTLPNIPYGDFVLIANDTYGDVAELKCYDDHLLDGGPSFTVCQADGTWSNTSAVCKPMGCDEGTLPSEPNGEFVLMAYGNVAELNCSDEHILVGGPSYVICQEDRTWTNTTAFCVHKDTNVAFGKETMQSTTYRLWNSSFAVDGNSDGYFGGASCSHTGFEALPWWIVDLGHVFPINYVVVYNRVDCCGDRLSNVYVMVSDTALSLTSNTLDGTQCGFVSVVGANHTFFCEPGLQGRYVKVTIANERNYLVMCEVEVYI